MYKNRIKELRTLELISQTALGAIINISQNTFSEYENEYKIIPLNHLNQLCNYFNVSLDYIFELTNTKKYKSSYKEINLELSSKRLKELRKKNKLTQTKLSEILNCSYGTIAGYESGRYVIATPFLYTICKKYNVSADYLLGKTDNPNF